MAWKSLAANVASSVDNDGAVTLSIDKIIVATKTTNCHVRSNAFWRSVQRAKNPVFRNVGLHVDFQPNRRGAQVQSVTFRPMQAEDLENVRPTALIVQSVRTGRFLIVTAGEINGQRAEWVPISEQPVSEELARAVDYLSRRKEYATYQAARNWLRMLARPAVTDTEVAPPEFAVILHVEECP